MPYLTPESIPPGKTCRALRIPDETAIIAAVTGAIEELAFSYNWELFGAVTPDEIALAMRDMFDEFCLERKSCRMIGEIIAFAGSSSPQPGWLLCDGASKLRADYPDLFAVIGTTYGAVDGTHFTLPDLSGKVGIGVSGSHALGSAAGEETHTLTEAEMPSHLHQIFISTVPVAPGAVPVLTGGAVPGNTTATGGSGAHNNMQPFLTLNYYIVAED